MNCEGFSIKDGGCIFCDIPLELELEDDPDPDPELGLELPELGLELPELVLEPDPELEPELGADPVCVCLSGKKYDES